MLEQLSEHRRAAPNDRFRLTAAVCKRGCRPVPSIGIPEGAVLAFHSFTVSARMRKSDMTRLSRSPFAITRWHLDRARQPVCDRIGRAKHPDERDYATDPLYNALTLMMLDWPRGGATDETRRDAWSQVAFVNFIGRVLKTRAAQDRPMHEDRERAAARFPALLAELNPSPQVCLVLDDSNNRDHFSRSRRSF